MLKNGIISVRTISNFFRKLLTKLLTIRSHQGLNRHSVIRIDTYERMRINKKGQDDMIEFVKLVPDECLIELSEMWFCNK